MEHCSASLADFLVSIKNFTFTEEQIAAIVQMTLEGLKSLHGNKKIHRDIKSGNILINLDGTCKIGADFLKDFCFSCSVLFLMYVRARAIYYFFFWSFVFSRFWS